MRNRFELLIIVIMGLLVGGVLILIFSDGTPDDPIIDNNMKNALKNVEYHHYSEGERSGGDTHYERVDRDKKYYGAMTDIKQNEDESIQITFSSNSFPGNEEARIEADIPNDLNYFATIKKDQIFVSACTLVNTYHGSDLSTPIDSHKFVGLLKYYGITEKDGIQYYVFHHEGLRLPKEIKCKFPEMIDYSLDIDFDIDINYSSFKDEIWDFDWN